MKMTPNLSFDDVLIVPQYSDIQSRSEIDIRNDLGKLNLSLPVLSAPMDSVTESVMATAMAKNGGLGIIHRYNTIQKQVKLAKKSRTPIVAAAVGVTGDYLDRAVALYNAGVKIICVDVAHGHHVLMRHALEVLRNTLGTQVTIIAGNVATLQAFNDLSDWGADAVRVGIGGGSICSTRIQTGHGVPTLQSVLDCAASDRPAKLIADGGIKNSGDIVKAYAAGADFVMLGSMLAGTTETPGDIRYKQFPGQCNPSKIKVYRGMASEDAQKDWRGKSSSVEGVATTIPYKGHVKNVLRSIERGVKSGFSYSGARSFAEFQAKAQLIRQTASSQVESSTHIERVN